MIVRCLLTKEEVTLALAKLALEKRQTPLPPGQHAAEATLLTMLDDAGAIKQVRVELDIPGVPA